MGWGGRLMAQAVLAVLVLLLAFMAEHAQSAVAAAVVRDLSPRGEYADAAELGMFHRWMEKHSRVYRSRSEEKRRFQIFKDNVQYIRNHNARQERYWMGLNRFSDLTHEEFNSQHLGVAPAGLGDRLRNEDASFMFADVVVRKSVDWRAEGAVSGVKNQGTCGSCWAFSAIGAIEGLHHIVTGEMVTFSEQELVDCDRGSNKGCSNGLMDRAFEFVIANGVSTENDYPYSGSDAARCDVGKKRNAKFAAIIDGYQDVPPRSEIALLQAVTKQPVSVAIESKGRDFQHYQGGVFTGACGTTLDHGVLVVGYDTDQDNQPYWLVKNSWGSSWGEKGYIRMARLGASDPDGKCGINTMASFPVKKAAAPPPPAPAKNAFKPCDNAGHSCPASSSCCCAVSTGAHCLQWGCCPVGSAICCSNNRCCPAEFPVCDLQGGRCLMSSNPFGVPMLKRTRAEFLWPNSIHS